MGAAAFAEVVGDVFASLVVVAAIFVAASCDLILAANKAIDEAEEDEAEEEDNADNDDEDTAGPKDGDGWPEVETKEAEDEEDEAEMGDGRDAEEEQGTGFKMSTTALRLLNPPFFILLNILSLDF